MAEDKGKGILAGIDVMGMLQNKLLDEISKESLFRVCILGPSEDSATVASSIFKPDYIDEVVVFDSDDEEIPPYDMIWCVKYDAVARDNIPVCKIDEITPETLEELVWWSAGNLPDKAKVQSFVIHEDYSLNIKEKFVNRAVNQHSAIALGISFVGGFVPLAEVPMLVGNELTIFARIARIYDITAIQDIVGLLGGNFIIGKILTLVGEAASTKLLDLVPGAGQLITGAIDGGVAMAVTKSFGTAMSKAMRIAHGRNDAIKQALPQLQLVSEKLSLQDKLKSKLVDNTPSPKDSGKGTKGSSKKGNSKNTPSKNDSGLNTVAIGAVAAGTMMATIDIGAKLFKSHKTPKPKANELSLPPAANTGDKFTIDTTVEGISSANTTVENTPSITDTAIQTVQTIQTVQSIKDSKPSIFSWAKDTFDKTAQCAKEGLDATVGGVKGTFDKAVEGGTKLIADITKPNKAALIAEKLKVTLSLYLDDIPITYCKAYDSIALKDKANKGSIDRVLKDKTYNITFKDIIGYVECPSMGGSWAGIVWTPDTIYYRAQDIGAVVHYDKIESLTIDEGNKCLIIAPCELCTENSVYKSGRLSKGGEVIGNISISIKDYNIDTLKECLEDMANCIIGDTEKPSI